MYFYYFRSLSTSLYFSLLKVNRRFNVFFVLHPAFFECPCIQNKNLLIANIIGISGAWQTESEGFRLRNHRLRWLQLSERRRRDLKYLNIGTAKSTRTDN